MEERIYVLIKYVFILYIFIIVKYVLIFLNKKMYIGWENYVFFVILIYGNLNNK